MDSLYHSGTRVEKTQDGLLARCEVTDEVFRGWVQVIAKLPDLAIIDAKAEILEGGRDENLSDTLGRLKGVRVGSGMNKIVPGLFKDSACPRLGEMFLEAMEGVILALTRPVLTDFHSRFGRPAEGAEAWLLPSILDDTGRAQLLEESPRLRNSCAAFLEEM